MAGYGEWLRRVRDRGGWSRRELAAAAGISEGAVRDYELGRSHPSLEAALRIAVAFGESMIRVENYPEMTQGVRRLQKASRRRRKRDTMRELNGEIAQLRRALAQPPAGADPIIMDLDKRLNDSLVAGEAARGEADTARQKAAQAEEARAQEEKARVQAEQALVEERRHREMESTLRQGQGSKQPTSRVRLGLDDTLPGEKPPPAEPPE